MPPVALPNLYCLPSDIYDLIGTEGVELRLDDRHLATAQTLVVTANQVAGATTLNVATLAHPILPGTVLHFDGAGMPAVVEVQTTALGKVGDTTLTVLALPAGINALAQADDSGVNVALAQRLVKACQYATSQCKLYLSARYDDSQLALCNSVNYWAQWIGARWLCRRQCQAAPKSIEEGCEEAYGQMERVQAGTLQLEDVNTRTSAWPFLSNVTIDTAYDICKIRVESVISEPTPTQYGQFVDWNSILGCGFGGYGY